MAVSFMQPLIRLRDPVHSFSFFSAYASFCQSLVTLAHLNLYYIIITAEVAAHCASAYMLLALALRHVLQARVLC